MKLLWGHKDGGPESEVQCWGIEIKSLFSILLLKFTPRTRDVYHAHAFDCFSWVLKGTLYEDRLNGTNRVFKASWKPFIVTREDCHKVVGNDEVNWALTFRGPWKNRWREETPAGERYELTHGRKRV